MLVNTTALERMDYLLMRAAALGLRLVLTLTNNWSDFGGMDVYGKFRLLQDPTYGEDGSLSASLPGAGCTHPTVTTPGQRPPRATFCTHHTAASSPPTG